MHNPTAHPNFGACVLAASAALLVSSCEKAEPRSERLDSKAGNAEEPLIEISSPIDSAKRINKFGGEAKAAIEDAKEKADEAIQLANKAKESLEEAKRSAEIQAAALREKIKRVDERLDDIEVINRDLEKTRDAAEKALDEEQAAIKRLYDNE
jgi:phage-related minor tail protein